MTMTIEGILKREDLGPGVWTITADDGRKFGVTGKVPEGLDGKRVKLDGKVAQGFGFGIGMTTGPEGPGVIEIASIVRA